MDQQIKTWVGTVIIVIFAITAGIFVWLVQKNNPIERSVQVSIPTKKQAVSATDENANWQTYRNEKYGFELQYPGDLKVTTEDFTDHAILNNREHYELLYEKEMYEKAIKAKEGALLLTLGMDKFRNVSDNPYLKLVEGYWFSMAINKTYKTDINEFVTSWRKDYDGVGIDKPTLLQINDISIANISGKELTFDGNGGLYDSVEFIKNGFLYSIDFNYDMGANEPNINNSEVKNARAIFNKMLSTFKFIK